MNPLPPDFDPQKLTLERASEEQKLVSWTHNSEAWKGQLSTEDYIGLQKLNGQQDLTKDGGVIYWVLTDAGGVVYCSAEILKKKTLSRLSDGQFRDHYSYGIAAVFTPRPWRRRGLASTMMQRLAQWLDAEKESYELSTLFSAVGGFYERFGWKIQKTEEIRIKVPPAAADTVDPPSPAEATLLTADALKPRCEADVEEVRREIRDGGGGKGNSQIRFLPTWETAAWHFGAEEYVASKLTSSSSSSSSAARGLLEPTHKGAASADGLAWCYWSHDISAGRLTILRVVFPPRAPSLLYRAIWGDPGAAALAAVMRAAAGEAARWGFGEVAVWDPSPRLVEVCRRAIPGNEGLRTEPHIDSYIPCLRLHSTFAPPGAGEDAAWAPRSAYQRC